MKLSELLEQRQLRARGEHKLLIELIDGMHDSLFNLINALGKQVDTVNAMSEDLSKRLKAIESKKTTRRKKAKE
jgi:Mg2+ and Co2+ transporter CorA